MNLLEHYIIEVHSIVDLTHKVTCIKSDTKYLEVDVSYDCYGIVERNKLILTQDEWDYILERGYFMG